MISHMKFPLWYACHMVYPQLLFTLIKLWGIYQCTVCWHVDCWDILVQLHIYTIINFNVTPVYQKCIIHIHPFEYSTHWGIMHITASTLAHVRINYYSKSIKYYFACKSLFSGAVCFKPSLLWATFIRNCLQVRKLGDTLCLPLYKRCWAGRIEKEPPRRLQVTKDTSSEAVETKVWPDSYLWNLGWHFWEIGIHWVCWRYHWFGIGVF